MRRMRVGWTTFTCSEDSTIVFVELLNRHFFDWSERIEFVYCKVLKSGGSLESVSDVDVFFVEGAISTDEEEKKLKHIRDVSKHVVAVGSCACTGMPSAQRNAFSLEAKSEIRGRLKKHHLREKVEPINAFVKVDDYVMGCPMVEQQFLKVMGKYLDMFNT